MKEELVLNQGNTLAPLNNMNIFSPETTIRNGLAVDIKDGQCRIFRYFIYNEGDGNFLNFSKPTGKAQPGLTRALITSSDFVRTSTSIPLFSNRAADIISSVAKNEIEFYECQVTTDQGIVSLFLGKVNLYKQLLDIENSEYRSLTDGSRLITRAKYLHQTNTDFYIARDINFKERLIVTDKFVNHVKQNDLAIGFVEPC